MKKGILLFAGMCLSFLIFSGAFSNKSAEGTEVNQAELKEKLIRFHVLANSDSEEDQTLKLKVRDRVLEYIAPILESSTSIEESREILKENNDTIIAIAKAVIKENGYDYGVTAELAYDNFPVKTYGNITLPQGEYEAFRILIGNAEGRNWWCIMFPPLCFVDVTKIEVAEPELEKRMKTVLTEDQYKSLTIDGKKVNLKLKVTELLRNL